MSQKSPTSVRRHPSPPRKSAGGTLLGVFIGIVIGVVISAAVVWYINGAPSPFRDKMQPAESLRGDSVEGTGQLAGEARGACAGTQTERRTQQDPDGTGWRVGGHRASRAKQPNTAATEQTFLQAGAFHSAAEADTQGQVCIARPGSQCAAGVVWQRNVFRVRLGPYAKPEDLARVRAELVRTGIQANLVKSSQ